MILKHKICKHFYLNQKAGYLLFPSSFVPFLDSDLKASVEYSGGVTGNYTVTYQIDDSCIQRFDKQKGAFIDECIEGDLVSECIDDENHYIIIKNRVVSYIKGNEPIWIDHDRIVRSSDLIWTDVFVRSLYKNEQPIGIEGIDPISREKIWSIIFKQTEQDISKNKPRKLLNKAWLDDIIIIGVASVRPGGGGFTMAINRYNGEVIWKIDNYLFTGKGYSSIYEGKYICLGRLKLIEVDAMTGKIIRDVNLDHLKSNQLQNISVNWQIQDRKIFFIDSRNLTTGILDYHTLELLDIETIKERKLENDYIIYIQEMVVHENKIYVVVRTEEGKNITYIYEY